MRHGPGEHRRGRAVIELTELLNDSERLVRAGAVRANRRGKPRQAEALLRFKVLIGDATRKCSESASRH